MQVKLFNKKKKVPRNTLMHGLAQASGGAGRCSSAGVRPPGRRVVPRIALARAAPSCCTEQCVSSPG